MKQRGFSQIDNAVVDRYGPLVGPYGLSVYLVLARFSDRTGQSWPSVCTVAERSGMSESQARRALKKLRDAGLITIEPRIGTNRYILAEVPQGKFKGQTF